MALTSGTNQASTTILGPIGAPRLNPRALAPLGTTNPLAGLAAQAEESLTNERIIQAADDAAKHEFIRDSGTGLPVLPEKRSSFTIYNQQYNEAIRKNYIIKLDSDIDKTLDDLADKHYLSPSNFSGAATTYLNTTAEAVDPVFKSVVKGLGQKRVSSLLSGIRARYSNLVISEAKKLSKQVVDNAIHVLDKAHFTDLYGDEYKKARDKVINEFTTRNPETQALFSSQSQVDDFKRQIDASYAVHLYRKRLSSLPYKDQIFALQAFIKTGSHIKIASNGEEYEFFPGYPEQTASERRKAAKLLIGEFKQNQYISNNITHNVLGEYKGREAAKLFKALTVENRVIYGPTVDALQDSPERLLGFLQDVTTKLKNAKSESDTQALLIMHANVFNTTVPETFQIDVPALIDEGESNTFIRGIISISQARRQVREGKVKEEQDASYRALLGEHREKLGRDMQKSLDRLGVKYNLAEETLKSLDLSQISLFKSLDDGPFIELGVRNEEEKSEISWSWLGGEALNFTDMAKQMNLSEGQLQDYFNKQFVGNVRKARQLIKDEIKESRNEKDFLYRKSTLTAGLTDLQAIENLYQMDAAAAMEGVSIGERQQSFGHNVEALKKAQKKRDDLAIAMKPFLDNGVRNANNESVIPLNQTLESQRLADQYILAIIPSDKHEFATNALTGVDESPEARELLKNLVKRIGVIPQSTITSIQGLVQSGSDIDLQKAAGLYNTLSGQSLGGILSGNISEALRSDTRKKLEYLSDFGTAPSILNWVRDPKFDGETKELGVNFWGNVPITPVAVSNLKQQHFDAWVTDKKVGADADKPVGSGLLGLPTSWKEVVGLISAAGLARHVAEASPLSDDQSQRQIRDRLRSQTAYLGALKEDQIPQAYREAVWKQVEAMGSYLIRTPGDADQIQRVIGLAAVAVNKKGEWGLGSFGYENPPGFGIKLQQNPVEMHTRDRDGGVAWLRQILEEYVNTNALQIDDSQLTPRSILADSTLSTGLMGTPIKEQYSSKNIRLLPTGRFSPVDGETPIYSVHVLPGGGEFPQPIIRGTELAPSQELDDPNPGEEVLGYLYFDPVLFLKARNNNLKNKAIFEKNQRLINYGFLNRNLEPGSSVKGAIGGVSIPSLKELQDNYPLKIADPLLGGHGLHNHWFGAWDDITILPSMKRIKDDFYYQTPWSRTPRDSQDYWTHFTKTEWGKTHTPYKLGSENPK